MPTVSIKAGLEGLPCLRTFRTRTMVGDSFWRLSGAPDAAGMLPEWHTKLMAAWALNRQRYMPYCLYCGKEVTFEHSVLRQWVHADEAKADHIAEQVSHPESYQPPPEGLRFLVTHLRVPLVWVLNDATIVVPDLPGTEHLARQARVVEAFGESIDPKFV